MSVSNSARIFRLFVSSTFSDFIAEREALQKTVFPELEEYCAQRGARFQAVDLRWGITEEAQREHDTMRICLEEVRRCQQLSPRPNFAVLLGDRYGWEPVPARIPQDHWRRLMKAATPVDWGLIEDSYKLDGNAIPPVYCLHERGRDLDRAFQQEAQLLQALRRAARGFRGSARLPYFASATHQEIALGALSKRDEKRKPLLPEQHVHVYVRHLSGLSQDEAAKDFIDWDASAGHVVPGARDRLRGLDKTLRERLPGRVHDLHTAWSRHGRNGAVNKAYLKRFCDAFLGHQKALIDAELDSLQLTDERQQREQAHQDFGVERARVFAGRQVLLARIARYTGTAPEARAIRPARQKPQTAPLMLLGGGGSGKSALLARAAQEAAQKAKRSGAIVLQRYIGGVPGTESLMTTLTALTADIASLYGQPEPPTPESAKALAEGFQAALGHATASRPLILYLDALDQLDKADSAWMLEWLPKALPEHVRVVASARKGSSVEQSARRRYAESLIDVPVMRHTEGRAMLKAWLADKRAASFNAGIAPFRGRRLTKQQEQAVLAAFKHTGSALWLKLAYEEAATWASWDAPRELPTTVQGLIEDLIDHRLIQQENHPKVFTERALAYLTAGRLGLSENELSRALGIDKRVRTEFQDNEKTQRKWEDEKLLPPIIWSRLYFDLQAYLGLAQIDGALLMRWFHREFAEVLKSKYLASDQDRREIHGALADTFLQLERELRPDEANDDALFKATDASGKQVSAALRRVMEQPWQLAQAEKKEDLQALLTDFGFCMGKCAANAGRDFIEDYQSSGISSGTGSMASGWLSLVREKGHLLRRGEVSWPAHKILLQVAVEQGDDGPVTLAAKAWLKAGLCSWLWARKVNRPQTVSPSRVVSVMEGHTDEVSGALALPEGQVISWSTDKTLRLWDGITGALLITLQGHTDSINQARLLPDGRVLTWCGEFSEDHTLRLWDVTTGMPLAVVEGHTDSVIGAEHLPDGRILSWSRDSTLRLWDGIRGEPLAVMQGHTQAVKGVQLLASNQVLSWSEDGQLRLWDLIDGRHLGDVKPFPLKEDPFSLPILSRTSLGIDAVVVISKDRVVCWSDSDSEAVDHSRRIAIFDIKAAEFSQSFSSSFQVSPKSQRGNYTVYERLAVRLIDDHRIAFWVTDQWTTFRDSWIPISDTDCWFLDAAVNNLEKISFVPASFPALFRIHDVWQGFKIIWEDVDNCLHVTPGDETGPTIDFIGHEGPVSGVMEVSSEHFVSWSEDGTCRIWNAGTGNPIEVLRGHSAAISGVDSVVSGKILTWSRDGTLRFWEIEGLPALVFAESEDQVAGALILARARVVVWSKGVNLDVYDLASGKILHNLRGHRGKIIGVTQCGADRLISWDSIGIILVWDLNAGKLLRNLTELFQNFHQVIDVIGEYIITESQDHIINVWNSNGFMLERCFRGHKEGVLGIKKLGNGRLLSWSRDGSLRLWGDDEMKSILFRAHTDAVRGAIELPDDRILSWSDDGSLILWDKNNGKAQALMDARDNWEHGVDGATVLTDGRIIAWGGGKITIWDGSSRTWLTGFPERKRSIGVFSGWPDGVVEGPEGLVFSWSETSFDILDTRTMSLVEHVESPWLESESHFTIAGDKDDFAGAMRSGDNWGQCNASGMVFRSSCGKGVAYWHGDSGRILGAFHGSFICIGINGLSVIQAITGG